MIIAISCEHADMPSFEADRTIRYKFASCLLFSHDHVFNPVLELTASVSSFYGCKPSSLTLRAERRLGTPENRFMRNTFVPQRKEVTRMGGNCIIAL
jgi:hypothetical protein